MPYEAEEDSSPKEDQNQQEVTPDQMETEELATVEAPAKKGMAIAVGPGEYQPVPSRYMRANEDSKDDKDTDEDEDIEAPYLAPKQNPTPKTPQDEKTAPILLKGKFASAKDSQVSSGDESIPELIDLREEEEVPPPSPPKKANHPTTLGLHEKIAVTTEKPPVFPFPPSKENAETLLVAAPGVHTEEVPEEQIIYVDDNADPSPLSLLERQVDYLLMPPPTGPTPITQKAPMSPKREHQPLKVPEKSRHSPQHYWEEDSPRKMKRETLEVEGSHSGQDAYRTSRSTSCPGTGQVGQYHGSSPETQHARRYPHQSPENHTRC